MLKLFFGLISSYAADDCVSAPENCGCKDVNYTDYRGKMNRTDEGYLCQNWADQSPQEHWNFKPEDFDDEDLSENYCRNPKGIEKRAWCYTTMVDKRWQYCPVPTCGDTTTTTTTYKPPCEGENGCACYEDRGRGYRGEMAKTVTGRDCLDWDSQDVITHSSWRPHDPKYINEGLEKNYCRNPRKEKKAPFCLIAGDDYLENWDYCPVEYCTETTTSTACMYLDPENCACAEDYYAGYRGKINVTKKGFVCADWDRTEPHFVHRFRPYVPLWTNAGLEKNYCRNPDNDKRGSWCYIIQESGNYDFCDIPRCKPDQPPSAIIVDIENKKVKLDGYKHPPYTKVPFVGAAYNYKSEKSSQVYFNKSHTYLMQYGGSHSYKGPAVTIDWTRQKDVKIVPMDMVIVPEQGYTAVCAQTSNLTNIVKDTGISLLDVYDESNERVWKARLEPAGAGDQINCALFTAPVEDTYSIGMVYQNFKPDEVTLEYISFDDEGHMSPRMVLKHVKTPYEVKASALKGNQFAVAYKSSYYSNVAVDYYDRETGEVTHSKVLDAEVTQKYGTQVFDMIGSISNMDDDEKVANEVYVVYVTSERNEIQMAKCDDTSCDDPVTMIKSPNTKTFPRLVEFAGGFYLFYYTQGSIVGQRYKMDGTTTINDRQVIATKGDISSLTLSKTGGDTPVIVVSGTYSKNNVEFSYTVDEYTFCDYHLAGGEMVIVDVVDPDSPDTFATMKLSVESSEDYDWDSSTKTVKFTPGLRPGFYNVTATDQQDKSYTLKVQWPQCDNFPKPPTTTTTSTPHVPTDIKYSIKNQDLYVTNYKQTKSVGPQPMSKRNEVTENNVIIYYDSEAEQLSAVQTERHTRYRDGPVDIGYKQKEGVVYLPSDVLVLPDDSFAVCMYAVDTQDLTKSFKGTFSYVVYYDAEMEMVFERALRFKEGGDQINCSLNAIKNDDGYDIGASVLSMDSENIEYYLLDGKKGGEDVDDTFPKTLVEDAADSYGTVSVSVVGGKFAFAYKLSSSSDLTVSLFDAKSGDKVTELVSVTGLSDGEGDKSFSMIGTDYNDDGEAANVEILYVDDSQNQIQYIKCDVDAQKCSDPKLVKEENVKVARPRLQHYEGSSMIAYEMTESGFIGVMQLESDLESVHQPPYVIKQTPAGNNIGALNVNVMNDYRVSISGYYEPSHRMFLFLAASTEYCDYRVKPSILTITDVVDPNPEDNMDTVDFSVESGGGQFTWNEDEKTLELHGVQPAIYYQLYAEDHTNLRFREAVQWPTCWDQN